MDEITFPYQFKLGQKFGINELEFILDRARENGFEKVQINLVSPDGDVEIEGKALPFGLRFFCDRNKPS